MREMIFINEYQQERNEIYNREKLICLLDWELVKFFLFLKKIVL